MQRIPYQLQRPLVFSTGVHVALLMFILFFSTFVLREPRLMITWVDLPKGPSPDISLGMKKAKDLPKSTIEQQKTRASEKQKALSPKQKTKMSEPTSKTSAKKKTPVKKLTPAEKKIQEALAKIDQQLKERPEDVAASGAEPEAAQVKDEGEGYEYGTGDTPLHAIPRDAEYLKYQAMIRMKIIDQWIIPPRYLEEGETANARLEVMINMDGDVIATRWASRSGNAAFDASTIRAIERASPFPKPPDRLAWEAYNEGFLIEFDPRLKP